MFCSSWPVGVRVQGGHVVRYGVLHVIPGSGNLRQRGVQAFFKVLTKCVRTNYSKYLRKEDCLFGSWDLRLGLYVTFYIFHTAHDFGKSKTMDRQPFCNK